MAKIKGLVRGKDLHELEIGTLFVHGGEVYVRCYLYVMEGKECIKTNAFRVEWGKPVLLDWNVEVQPLHAKYEVAS